MNFCKCGSVKIDEKCSNDHCPWKNQKCKDWIVDGTGINFKRAVSYEEAAGIAERLKNSENNP